MFTILYRDETGLETILGDIRSVQRIPAGSIKDPAPRVGGVSVIFADGVEGFYEGNRPTSTDAVPREIYVMNEHGKTVAKWGL